MTTRLLIFIAFGWVVSAESISNYTPITPKGRLQWFAKANVGPAALGGHVINGAWLTMRGSPEEYGPHWDGFGKRIGLRAAGTATGTAMEASLGAIWGEDPRYFRAGEQPFKRRLGHVVKQAFVAHNRNGRQVPAYARYSTWVGNGFLQNAWRPDSQTQTSDALMRVPFGIMGKLASNAFAEFWPDIVRRH